MCLKTNKKPFKAKGPITCWVVRKVIGDKIFSPYRNKNEWIVGKTYYAKFEEGISHLLIYQMFGLNDISGHYIISKGFFHSHKTRSSARKLRRVLEAQYNNTNARFVVYKSEICQGSVVFDSDKTKYKDAEYASTLLKLIKRV